MIDNALREKALDAAVDAHYLVVGVPSVILSGSTRQAAADMLRPAVYAAIAVIAGAAE